MGAHNILQVNTTIKELIGLYVRILIRLACRLTIVLFGKEPGRSQNDGGNPVVPMKQFTKVFGRSLCNSVNVSGDGRNILRDPDCRGSSRWCQRPTKDAGGAGEDKGANSRRYSLLQKHKGARDIRIDEFLPG